MAYPNTNYSGDLIAGTFERVLRKTPTDAIFENLVLFRMLASKDQIKRKGGNKLIVPVRYAKSTAVGSYSGNDVLDITPQEHLTHFEFDWKQYFGSVAFDNRTVLLNDAGDAQILDIVKERFEAAKLSLGDKMNQDCFLDGTGNSSKDITGLAAAVDSSGTYGGISRTTNVWAKAVETAVGGVLALSGTTGMRRMNNDVSLGQGMLQPDFLLTTQIVFEAYEALMDANMRYSTQDDKSPVIPGQNLKFKNGSMYWDSYCQSGILYFLNTKFMELVVYPQRDGSISEGEEHNSADFRMGEKRIPTNQDSWVQLFFWMGNLVCRSPRNQGKLTGLTNS